MKARSCKKPGCEAKTRRKDGYCAAHAPASSRRRAAGDRHYDRYQRDPAAKKFYNSKAWKDARTFKLSTCAVCERCRRVFAAHVHHIKPLEDCSDEEKTAQDNLLAVCHACHNAIEAELKRQAAGLAEPGDPDLIVGIFDVKPDPRFYYDEKAAERPIRFIEKFCKHHEGRFAGKPFTLLDWQKEVIRKLFGWKWKSNGLRRFTALYIIAAKGVGKTPFLSAIALYMLFADGEASPHVISMASVTDQAKLTFNAGQQYIRDNDDLLELEDVEVQEKTIWAPLNGKWTMISGKPTGKSGGRPSCIIADELHEWPAPTAKAFTLLCANLFKRPQPLLLMATNAGPDRNCFAWTVHEKARKVLSGEVEDVQLLPVIYEAGRDLDWRSEQAAAAANPSMGKIVPFERIQAEQEKQGEPDYRRLYLSQWVAGGEKWLDLDQWDACLGVIDEAWAAEAALYVGVDLSNGDDLCAVVYIFILRDLVAIRPTFFLPKKTAAEYEEKNGYAYSKWAEAGDITLIDEETISTEVKVRIAEQIIATHGTHKIEAVCYDRAYVGITVPKLQEAGIECRPVGQAYGVATGTSELERRIKERSVIIEPNDVLRFCAENTEVKGDTHGNIWPVKPLAKGTYAGRRGNKIDGITATVTGLTEAAQHDFPDTAKLYQGTVTTLNQDDAA